jgi:hypothetical protein
LARRDFFPPNVALDKFEFETTVLNGDILIFQIVNLLLALVETNELDKKERKKLEKSRKHCLLIIIDSTRSSRVNPKKFCLVK